MLNPQDLRRIGEIIKVRPLMTAKLCNSFNRSDSTRNHLFQRFYSAAGKAIVPIYILRTNKLIIPNDIAQEASVDFRRGIKLNKT